MESSHITGDHGEGCNSSESGWTMYLASPMQGDDDGYDAGLSKGSGSDGSNVDDGYGYAYILHARKGGKECQDDGDDNDSLASDASTGPAKSKVQPSSPDGKDDQGHPKHGAPEYNDDKPEEEEDDTHTRFSTTSTRKKAGNKTEKDGEGKSSKRGHGKRGSSSRTSFFW